MTRLTRRWMDQNAGLGHVTPEAFGLLARRLAARYRAALLAIPFVGVAVGAWVSAMSHSSTQGTATGDEMFAARALMSYGAIAVGGTVITWWANRAESRIGRSLPHRVSRGSAVRLRTILGRTRATFLLVAIVVEAAMAVTLLALGAGWFAWAFLAAFAVAVGLVAVGVRQASTRATLAVDPVSLAIDERLRAHDAFSATFPLFLVLIGFPGGGFTNSPSWLQLVWLITVLVVGALWVWSSIKAPWGSVLADRRIASHAWTVEPS